MPDHESERSHSDQFIMYVPTDRLEKILHDAMLSEDAPFPAQAQAAAAELARRQTDAQRSEAKAAWEQFQAERAGEDSAFGDLIPDRATQPSGTGKKGHTGAARSMSRIALIAAAALVTLAIGAYAAGVDLFGLFARWSEEHLRLPATVEDTAEATGAYDDLFAELNLYTSARDIVPTYLPVGYSLQDITVSTQEDESVYISALFVSGDEAFIFTYRSSQSKQVEYPKDGGNPEAFEQNGVYYYIFTNENNCSATWVNTGFECSISGLSDRDELIRIVRSIGTKE